MRPSAKTGDAEKFPPMRSCQTISPVKLQAEMKTLYTTGSNLANRLFVADYGGMTDEESKAIQKEFFKLRHDRLDVLEKHARKLDRKLPETKVVQFVQVENKIQALLDVAAAASIPIVTETPNTLK